MSSKPLGFGNRRIDPNPADVRDKLSLAASMKPTPVSDDLPTAKDTVPVTINFTQCRQKFPLSPPRYKNITRSHI